MQACISSIFRRVRQRVSKPILVTCPKCGRSVPATSVECPRCHANLSVEAAFDETVAPARRRWQRFAKSLSPQTKQRIRWAYCLISVFLLCEVLGYAETYHAKAWPLHAALCVVYLAVILFLFVWLAPREELKKFAQDVPRVSKLALFFNYLTLLMLLEIAVGTWWTRALMLAALFVVTWAGARLYVGFLEKEYRDLLAILFGEPNSAVDPSAPQGRHGRVG